MSAAAASASSDAPAPRHSRTVELALLAAMLVAALALVGLHAHPALTQQELDFVVIPLVGAAFAFASACYVLGWRSALVFFALAAVLSWCIEEAGVRTGAIFGDYTYGAALGPKLGSVPYVIPIFWFMILWVSYAIGNLLTEGELDARAATWVGTLWLSLLGALIGTAYDLGLDPYMSSPEIAAWTWAEPGDYYGVPLQNYLGWIFTGFVILLVFRRVHRTLRGAHPTGRLTRLVAALPILVYASFWISLLGPKHPGGTRVVCLIALGIPAMAAIAVWERWKVGAAASGATTAEEAAA